MSGDKYKRWYKLYSSTDGTTYTEIPGPADDETTAGGGIIYRKTADSSGSVTFTLKHWQKIELMIPANTQVSLTEQTDYYTASFTAAKTDPGSTGQVNLTMLPDGAAESEVNGVRLKAEENTTVTVTNNLDTFSPTGISLTYMPYHLMLLCGAALMLLIRKKRSA